MGPRGLAQRIVGRPLDVGVEEGPHPVAGVALQRPQDVGLPVLRQVHVLRALEGNAGAGVRAFFDAYIERTPDDALREAARARRAGS